ncbi:MAG: CPBP family intramembrane glutamic endopeptidase [Cyanobacteria bacterium P01_F01_bin.150]
MGISDPNLLFGSFLFGLIIGVVGIAGLFSLFKGLGWITPNSLQLALPHTPEIKEKVEKTDASSAISNNESLLSAVTMLIPSFLILGLIVGGVEELVFRGFLTGRLCEVWPVWISGAISSAVFALLHLVWEGKDNIPQLPGLWTMGMVLTLAWWIDDGAIALAWGLHTGWVWSMATIDALELVTYTHTVPAWVTGIDNKPLAGIMGVSSLVLTGLGILFFFEH